MFFADLCVKRPVFATIRTVSRFNGEDAAFKAGLTGRAKRHGGITAFVLPVERTI